MTACAMQKGGCFKETDYGYVAAVLDRTALWMGRQLNKMTANGWMTAGEETSMTATVFHTPGAERAESTQMASWLGKTTYVNACQTIWRLLLVVLYTLNPFCNTTIPIHLSVVQP